MSSSNQPDEPTNEGNEIDVCDDGVRAHLEPRFECPICLTWLNDPVLTSCGHKFCSQCISTWLQKKGACCPVDSKPLKSETDLFRDLYTSREISQQRIKCLYQRFGCTVELSPVDIDTHVMDCPYKDNHENQQEISCQFKDVGCTLTFPTEEALGKHVQMGLHGHLTMVLNALPRVSIASRDVSSMDAESKLWDPPPKTEEQTGRSEPPSEWQQLLKNLYERIVILEQQNRELSITISNQKDQNNQVLQSLLRFNHEEMTLRYCNGIYIWRLNSFREKLATMIKDPQTMFYSPGFYTCPNGYKICARMNVSSKDPDYLSILLHIMKSENDDALDWPFNGTMYFVLVHPHDSEKDIRELTFSRPDLEAFRKPTCELNKRSFGYTEFVRVRDVTEFLREDSLLFRIEVKVCNTFGPSTL